MREKEGKKEKGREVSEEVKEFYESIKLQYQFLEEVKDLEIEDVNNLVEAFTSYLTEDISHRSIHILGTGRSRLSAQSFLQGLYNVTFKIPERHRFYPATLTDGIVKFIGKSSLVLIVSGSGETKEVIRYLKNAVNCGSRIVLITGNENSTAYRIVSKIDGGTSVLLKSQSKYDSAVDEAYMKLSPLGSEFEFKTWVLLNSIVPEIRVRLQGKCRDTSCTEYKKRIELFGDNIKLLRDTEWIDDDALNGWINRLTKRHGLFVFFGISRSGHVAEQFEMRFAHADKKVFMLEDSNRKPFRCGDAFIVLSGSGNTLDVVEAAMDAVNIEERDGKLKLKDDRKNMIHLFGISMNKKSRLKEILDFIGQSDNLLLLPIVKEYEKVLIDSTSNNIISPLDIDKFRIPIFETSALVVTNAIVAQVGKNEGIIPHIFFGKEHV